MADIKLEMIAPRPQRPSTDAQYEPAQWIFIEDMRVVGFVEADCVVCAWRDGHPRYPNAIMAFIAVRIEDNEPCIWHQQKGV